MVVRRAKIVCTIGPAVEAPGAIHALIEAGMNVARLNFSHGTPAEHAAAAASIREASQKIGRPIAILQDLCGPKIRTEGQGPVELVRGAEVELVGSGEGDGQTLVVSYPRLARDMRVGDRILLSDGQIQLSVVAISAGRVRCLIEHGGKLRPRMGVNLPSKRLSLRALTDKDKSDLECGLGLGVDYIALSFVRTAADIQELRALCTARGKRTPIVAKIETPDAVDNLDAIVSAADAVMVARGDLGVELPPERVPVVQRHILGICRLRRKPAIIATEMLHSMVSSVLPTRAEVSDVAGAVFGGADAVMLSAETATGEHPIQACKMMDRIIRTAEGSEYFHPQMATPGTHTPEAIAHAACQIASEVGARLIVALTVSGGTARFVSKARPKVPVAAFSPDDRTLRQLALVWGVEPHPLELSGDIEQFVERTRQHLVGKGLLGSGDAFVMVYGAPLGVTGTTNAVRVERVP